MFGRLKQIVWIIKRDCKRYDLLCVGCRSATLDNWVELMLSTVPGRRCDPTVLRTNINHSQSCGHILSIPYFVSFNFLSAFLVTTIITGM